MTAPPSARRCVRFEDGPHPNPHVVVDDAAGTYLGSFATENVCERRCHRATPPIEEDPSADA